MKMLNESLLAGILVILLLSSCGGSQEISSLKKLEIYNDVNLCLASSNEDAVTDFDFDNTMRRMLSWNCVTGVSSNDSATKLDLIFSFDSKLGCYKKSIDGNRTMYGGSYSTKGIPDCRNKAKSVIKPVMSGEISRFDVKFSPYNGGAYAFANASFELKNTGNIPITNYSSFYLEYSSRIKLNFPYEFKNESHTLLPGEVYNGTVTPSNQLFEVGDEVKFVLTIKDFEDRIIDTETKIITVN